MDKNIRTAYGSGDILGAVTLCTAGLRVDGFYFDYAVDKRTEVINVKARSLSSKLLMN